MTTERPRAPLAHLRVLELGTGIAAPYAGRLLAMLGATVVKVEPEDGDPARAYPIDDRPRAGLSPLYLHLNADKRNVAASAWPPAKALAWADVVLDSRVRAQLAGGALDPERLRREHPQSLLASVTAWGFEATVAGEIDDELRVQAASGVTAVTGDPDGVPLRLPGWQSQYLAGAYTAAGVLAALQGDAAPRPHLDIAWVSCMATGVEGGFTRSAFVGRDLERQGAHAPAVFPSGAIRCADGFVAPGTVRPHDWQMQCLMYGLPELLEDERFRTPQERAANYRALWQLIQPWYDAHTRAAIFRESLDLGLAMGMVLDPTDALRDEHLRARGFLARQRSPEGPFVAPARPCIMPGVEPRRSQVKDAGEDRPPSPRRLRSGGTPTTAPGLPLAGVRLVELTTAWAGPFVGRFLGALGADVIKVESARSYDLWRGPVRLDPAATGPYPDGVPGERPYNRAGNFNALNRNKRGLCLDIATPQGREVLLRLLGQADALLTNFTTRVLPNLGLGETALRAAKPDLVFLTMPALGGSGPYTAAAGYGTIIEAMGGFGARFGGREEGARISQTYYPDAVAGIHATVALLAALDHRRRTGEGRFVDLSQQEAMWLQLGEGIVAASLDGRDPDRMGNVEPGHAPSGIFPTADGGWVAIVARSVDEAARLRALIGDGADAGGLDESWEARLAGWTASHARGELLHLLAGAGIGAAPANTYQQALREPALLAVDAFERLNHADAGEQTYLRVPLRFDGTPVRSRRASPCFGEHSDEVLAEAGISSETIAALRGACIVADQPIG